MDKNIIPFRRKKKKKAFDWLEGVTPRKPSRRFPIAGVVGLALGILMAAIAIFLPPDAVLRMKSTWISSLRPSEEITQTSASPSQDQLQERADQTSASSFPSVENFRLCFTGSGDNCVVDGDTFYYHSAKIRIADIDTPETHPPRCVQEAELGRRATLRLQELLNQGPFTLETTEQDHDQYGRQLRIVMRGGASLGERMVDEGLARRWTGSRQPWC